ncbi:helix-turn-helix transcriptional regulator [Candidatus Micrarchaeota archaeon]|nr:helix-turn-helix transcriptional regulator [Candidatus Micrarchaeota archaeon]
MDDLEIVEFCKKVNLISRRDIDKTVIVVLRSVLSMGYPVGSTELARISGLHRLTCRYHLERLKDFGLLDEENGKYKMHFSSIREYVVYRRNEMLAMFREVEEIAKRMDEEFSGVWGEDDEQRGKKRKRKKRERLFAKW